MDRQRYDAPMRGRAALAVLAAAVLAVLAPSLLSTVAEAPATVGLTVLAVLLAALVRLSDHALVIGGRLAVTGPAVRRAVPPVLTGQVTDTSHHPLRPRAPGTA